VIKLLLEREDVDPNRPSKDDGTPLSWAASQGHEGVVKLLLERQNVDPDRLGKDDQTPLGWAAICGYEGVVKLLPERGDVNPNLPDKHYVTPSLMLEADMGESSSCSKLRNLLQLQMRRLPTNLPMTKLWCSSGTACSVYCAQIALHYPHSSPSPPSLRKSSIYYCFHHHPVNPLRQSEESNLDSSRPPFPGNAT